MPPQGQQTTEDVLKRLARMGLSMPAKSAPTPEPRPSVGTLLPAPQGPMLKIPERPSSEGPANQFSPGLLGTFQRLLMGTMEAGGSALGVRDPLSSESTRFDIGGGLLGAMLPVAGAIKVIKTPGEAAKTGGTLESILGKFKSTKPSTLKKAIEEGGFSVNPKTGEAPTAGVMMGVSPNTAGTTLRQPVTISRAQLERHANDPKVRALLEKSDEMYFGGWKSNEDGKDVFYIEPSKRFGPTEAEILAEMGTPKTMKSTGEVRYPRTREQAIANLYEREDYMRKATKVGEETGQKAGWDVSASRETPVGSHPDFLRSPAFQQRLDDMQAAGKVAMSDQVHEWWSLYGTLFEEIYGKERIRPLAGFLASTSNRTMPEENLRQATEYMRRLIKDEPIIQPKYRFGPGNVKYAEGGMMPFEATSRKANLLKSAVGDLDSIQADKMNDMAHVLVGDKVLVLDTHYSKLGEDPASGVFGQTKGKVVGQGIRKGGRAGRGVETIHEYPIMENEVRRGAARYGEDVEKFSARVWEGIKHTIRTTGQLYGQKHGAHTVGEAIGGFPDLLPGLLQQTAAKRGLTVEQVKKMLGDGDITLLTTLLSTTAGEAAYRQWQQSQPDAPMTSRRQ